MDFVDAKERVVFFGGGAGGGKTYASLVDNLSGIHDPDYTSVFFRKSTTEIEKGLWLEAKKMYHDILFSDRESKKPRGKSHISEKQKTITWPKGGKTFFSYLELDKHADSWYGLEITKIYFEEFQFTSWYQFSVLRSRNRSMAKVTKGIRCTLNPDPHHFVYKFVERYLDEDGYPRKELSGKTAYFLIVKDELHTSWDKQALIEMFPPKAGKRQKIPISYSYIPATLEDNKELMERDPDYIDVLEAMPEVKRKQLLKGCWKSTESSGMYFKREWVAEVDKRPLMANKSRGYDLAATEPTATTDPDYTANVAMDKCRDGYYYLIGDYLPNMKDGDTKVLGRYRKRSGERDKLILEQARYDGTETDIIIPEDVGGAAKDAFIEKVKYFTGHGFKIRKDPAAHNARKLTKFEPFCVAAEHGLVKIVRNTFNDETYEALMNELESFDGITKSGRKRKDDWVDSVGTNFNYLCKSTVIPDIKLPDLRVRNPYRN